MSTFEDLLGSDGRIDPRRWSLFWQTALRFPPPHADDPDPAVADEALLLWHERVATACVAAKSVAVAVQVVAQTIPDFALVDRARKVNERATALFDIVKSTTDPSAIVAGVLSPLLYAGNKAVLWRASQLYSDLVARNVETDAVSQAIGETLDGAANALSRAWETVVEAAAALPDAVKSAGVGIGAAALGLAVLYLATRPG